MFITWNAAVVPLVAGDATDKIGLRETICMCVEASPFKGCNREEDQQNRKASFHEHVLRRIIWRLDFIPSTSIFGNDAGVADRPRAGWMVPSSLPHGMMLPGLMRPSARSPRNRLNDSTSLFLSSFMLSDDWALSVTLRKATIHLILDTKC